ncbi:MAG: zinc ribbon domain-containing protein [Thermoplasmata archaeon]
MKLSDRIYHCNMCGLTIDRDVNTAINIERKGMEKIEDHINVGRGTPELTLVEIRSIPERVNQVTETGIPLR